jgi:hypothetical protein
MPCRTQHGDDVQGIRLGSSASAALQEEEEFETCRSMAYDNEEEPHNMYLWKHQDDESLVDDEYVEGIHICTPLKDSSLAFGFVLESHTRVSLCVHCFWIACLLLLRELVYAISDLL